MAKRKAATNKRPAAKTTPEKAEPKVIALAERLGTLLGRARNKADGLLNKATLRPKSVARKTKKSAAVPKPPGKRSRKPPPEELFDPRLGEPMGKQMGQKSVGKGRGARS